MVVCGDGLGMGGVGGVKEERTCLRYTWFANYNIILSVLY